LPESKTNPPPETSTELPTFEAALSALEQIVGDLETGRLGLAESLSRYEEGIKLLRQCYRQVEQAERRIEVLTGVDAAGNPVVQPYDDEATVAAGQEQALPRSRRRAKAAKGTQAESLGQAESPSFGMDEPGSLF
jgi:exodeoxyribonuclease VII small subunit